MIIEISFGYLNQALSIIIGLLMYITAYYVIRNKENHRRIAEALYLCIFGTLSIFDKWLPSEITWVTDICIIAYGVKIYLNQRKLKAKYKGHEEG